MTAPDAAPGPASDAVPDVAPVAVPAPATAPGPVGGPQSLDRALDVLDAVAAADGPLTARALAEHLDCALSTVYTLLGPLTARGHLARTSGGYTLGHRIPVLHRAYQRQQRFGRDVRDLLLQVRRVAGAEAYFSTFRDGGITVVDSTTPVSAQGEPFAVGVEQQAHATAHGKVLLAGVPRAARRRYLAEHGLPRFTERTITCPERFESELRRVRAQGYAVSVGEYDAGLCCVAVPLALPLLPPAGADGPSGVRPAGPAVQALSVSLPLADHRRRHREVTAVLTRAARQAA
ncbi:IclR family transcriptional regulator [Kitasatospora camelliae]|uniref:IclR family transcriptional regulator C-terminal domain-containing protein n=1 Tax=Kitasatospora camelliae TaxID=3156397 RepID=A0AAU8JQB3_9ACTN